MSDRGERDTLGKRLNITPGIREKHDYRRDTAFDGRRLVRLPDRTLVPADEYDARLRDHERQRAAAPARLRDVRLGDSVALAGLVSQLGYPTEPAAMRRRLATILGRTDFGTFVAEADGEVVAFGSAQLCPSFNRDRPSGRISALVVDESHRGRGIGRRLVERLEAWLEGAGAGHVFVNSRTHRGDAHRFYERLGYASNGLRLVRDLVRGPGAENPGRA